jgi:hypothetical protein
MTIRWTSCAALLGMAMLGVAGCGGGSGDAACAAKAGAAPGAVQAPADCAVDTVVAIDATGALLDKALARDVSAAASRAAEHTITAGGHLRMFVFAGDANAVEIIYDDNVQTLQQSDETRRGPEEQSVRTAIASELDSALGVGGDDPALRRRVRELARGGTSDIARAVRNGLRSLRGGSGAKAMTLVSDGAQSSDQLKLSRSIAAGGSASKLGAKLGDLIGSASGVDVLQVAGLGRLPGRVNQSARRTDELVEIWRTACEQAGAAQCEMTTEL